MIVGVGRVVLAWLGLASFSASAFGQAAVAAPPQVEPIYWRQNLFLIPYQWSSTQDPQSARAVWLYVSKDRGVSWQQISEARPEVRAFTYHAEGDGEYWFAIRTVDATGRTLPITPMQPELRVIVDTAIPRIEELTAVPRADGSVDVTCRASDLNLDEKTWAIELQAEANGDWQSVPLASAPSPGYVTCLLPAGSRVAAVRATVCDRAGNHALSQSSVHGAAKDNVAAIAMPPGPSGPQFISARGDAATVSNPAVPAMSAAAPVIAAPTQQWPADRTAAGWSAAPTGGQGAVAGGETKFGTPKSIGWNGPDQLAQSGGTTVDSAAAIPEPKPDDRPLGDVPLANKPAFTPLEPFREAATSQAVGGNKVPAREASLGGDDPKAMSVEHGVSAGRVEPSLATATPERPGPSLQGRGISPLQNGAVKMVNSRTFALEYELEDVSQRGVAKVELWGTRDRGQTWRSFAVDNDNRSPLAVTVDGEGMYGFRIVVEGADGLGGFAPHTGDAPDLWVGVDLHRPQVELTSVDPGHGPDVGHLMLRWRAHDDNLESRPIALFYSSRPTGPWTAIATSLENTGEYAWRVERHVPPKVYLRAEARDTAGNMAAYQTTEPIAVEFAPPSGKAQSVRPIESNDGPTAARSKDWSR